METKTLLTMIAIIGVVWGGFLVVLTIALRKEKAKKADPSE
jgi:LPS O-antigen subunit length determinant protein (WzzB/FepE family)